MKFGATVVFSLVVYAASTSMLPAQETGPQTSFSDATRAKLRLLITEYAAEKENIQVTPKEVDQHVAYMDEQQAGYLGEFQERKRELLEELEHPGISEKRRAEIEENIKVVNKLVQFEEERAKLRQDPEQVTLELGAGRRVGEMAIRDWKFRQALYRRYGGRVIFQQAGWEPIDAIQKFYADYKASEAFANLEPMYKEAFEEMLEEFDRYYDLGHVDMEQAQVDFYFEKPWWERTEEEWQAFES